MRRGTPATWIVAAAIAAAAAILTVELFLPPIIGLANNGDFEKVMGPVGVQYRETGYNEKYLGHVVARFSTVPPGWYRGSYRSSEILLADVARELAGAFSPNGLFDIRVLGAVHAFLFLVALGLLLGACRDLAPAAQCTAAALLVFCFTDVGYAGPFNSFYSQTASLLFLLLAAGCAALAIANTDRRGGIPLLAYFLCAALFVASKPQESIQGPILAAFGLRLGGAREGPAWRRAPVWLAAGLCVFSFWYYRQTPRDSIRNVGLFHTVFMEILPHSPDAGRDLEELGLDRGLLEYSGTNAYAPNAPLTDPGFVSRFYDRFDYATLVRFYLARPARLVERLRRGAPAAFALRPWRLGNYTADSGFAANTMTRRFGWWSGSKLKLQHGAELWLLLLLGGNVAACASGYRRASRRGRLFREGIWLLVLVAIVEYLVCALADYLGDLGRHLYVFEALCDLILVADAAWLANTVARRVRGPAVVTA